MHVCMRGIRGHGGSMFDGWIACEGYRKGSLVGRFKATRNPQFAGYLDAEYMGKETFCAKEELFEGKGRKGLCE